MVYQSVENNVSLTTLEESWRQSVPADDAVSDACRQKRCIKDYGFEPSGLYLSMTGSAASRSFHQGRVAFSVYGDANTVFLEDAGETAAKDLPYALDEEDITRYRITART